VSYDPELPRGFQDADFDLRDLEARAREVQAARRRGICDHGWNQGPYQGAGVHPFWQGPADAPVGSFFCFHCKAVLVSDPFGGR
jgi:hypothetical protein